MSVTTSSLNTTSTLVIERETKPMDGGGSHGAMPPSLNGTVPIHRHKMMMHMSFFWGTNSEILFTGWPGSDPGMYALALVFVFFLSVLVEWLSHCRILRVGSGHVVGGLAQTLMHGIRVGLAYLVMLAVMSFNVGVFLVAVAGHALGFLLFGSRVFKRGEEERGEKMTDLPPMSC